jgi:hypothetical protein
MWTEPLGLLVSRLSVLADNIPRRSGGNRECDYFSHPLSSGYSRVDKNKEETGRHRADGISLQISGTGNRTVQFCYTSLTGYAKSEIKCL